ncbi:hypothetical protein [Psittacicella hinzii]|uniref:Uncharacterized protein n=1 Tax=Psittacicella hinzii TaxID=2028575 RepID=A0A3A1YB50_9GAMM|nr:hypothetical protein [Psittacicella hinzii]RIY34895.1 hypothetical protein CKF58_07405 [Psittacicella hinzii]
MSNSDSKKTNRKRRNRPKKSMVPDPHDLATNYIDDIIADLPLRKKDRLELLTNKLIEELGYPNCLDEEVVDSFVNNPHAKVYDPMYVVIDPKFSVRSIYYDRIKTLKHFTYDLNTDVNYQTHKPGTPIRNYYDRERVKRAQELAGFKNCTEIR